MGGGPAANSPAATAQFNDLLRRVLNDVRSLRTQLLAEAGLLPTTSSDMSVAEDNDGAAIIRASTPIPQPGSAGSEKKALVSVSVSMSPPVYRTPLSVHAAGSASSSSSSTHSSEEAYTAGGNTTDDQSLHTSRQRRKRQGDGRHHHNDGANDDDDIDAGTNDSIDPLAAADAAAGAAARAAMAAAASPATAHRQRVDYIARTFVKDMRAELGLSLIHI